MPTKIINVLKDDKLEEILDIFRETSADEVIFVLPKTSLALNCEEHFAVLSREAEDSGKTVSVLSPNPNINLVAQQYDFGTLADDIDDEDGELDGDNTNQTKKDEYDDDNGDDGDTKNEGDADGIKIFDNRNNILEEMGSSENEPQIITALARNKKTVNDIVGPAPKDNQTKLKASKPLNPVGRSNQSVPVKLRREISQNNDGGQDKDPLGSIEKIWRSSGDNWDLAGRGQHKKFKNFFTFSLPKKSAVRRLSGKTGYAIGMVIMALVLVFVFFNAGSASVVIYPKSELLNLNLTVNASETFDKVDADSNKIPGQTFLIEKKIEQDFPATGERDVAQKARGLITVFNEYGSAPQTLIATTRFESENGLIFRTLKTILVPGTTVKNGIIIPGSIRVEVVADKPGDTYNIPAGKFTIPAFKERGYSDHYNKFYGSSSEPMKNGITGKAKIVTDQDFASAEKIIKEKLAAELKNELNRLSTGLKITVTPDPVLGPLISSAKVDEAAENFKLTAEGRIETVGFRESDLYQFISEHVSSKNNLTVIAEKLSIDYKNSQLSSDKNLNFQITVKGPAYGSVDQRQIIDDLVGKNEKEIKDYITSIDAIGTTKISLSPPWIKKVPRNKDKIKIEVIYE